MDFAKNQRVKNVEGNKFGEASLFFHGEQGFGKRGVSMQTHFDFRRETRTAFDRLESTVRESFTRINFNQGTRGGAAGNKA